MDKNDLVRRVNQETVEEEAKEEPAKTLQHRPRKRDMEQQGEGTGSELDNTPKTCSTVVEPKMKEEPVIRPKAVTMVQQEPVTEELTPPGLQISSTRKVVRSGHWNR